MGSKNTRETPTPSRPTTTMASTAAAGSGTESPKRPPARNTVR